MIFIVLALLAVGLVAWLAFELWRAPLCCNRTELPVDQCPCCQGKEGREDWNYQAADALEALAVGTISAGAKQ